MEKSLGDKGNTQKAVSVSDVDTISFLLDVELFLDPFTLSDDLFCEGLHTTSL